MALVCTVNDDGTAGLAPISSVWALGCLLVLGLGATGQSARDLAARPELVAGFPDARDRSRVERPAPLPGRDPVSSGKPPGTRFEADKFATAGVGMRASQEAAPPRVAGCPLRSEARAVRVEADGSGEHVVAQAQVVRVHAGARMAVPGTGHVDPGLWTPLIYGFRHCFGLGRQRGRSYRSQTPER
ncbi:MULTISPECIES: flavin reductase family protein [Nocardiopsis]|uniref:flavin reductase family protein n=1 Tax=Nocardiopsis TaxID=2013 RepID=UPI001F2FD1E8|nr:MULTISPECIES: flavin reductase family protein [Nocardiopsis]